MPLVAADQPLFFFSVSPFGFVSIFGYSQNLTLHSNFSVHTQVLGNKSTYNYQITTRPPPSFAYFCRGLMTFAVSVFHCMHLSVSSFL